MNDMKFTTAGDYMADCEPENFKSVTTVVRNKEQIYDIQVEKDVAEIINLIMLREYTVMRYELGIR
tara:strand:- start:312 stop:509 length:198 start_codon:yes stop_codon:yes gene_type:complete